MARWRTSFSLDGARWRRYAIGLPLHCHFAAQARAVALLVRVDSPGCALLAVDRRLVGGRQRRTPGWAVGPAKGMNAPSVSPTGGPCTQMAVEWQTNGVPTPLTARNAGVVRAASTSGGTSGSSVRRGESRSVGGGEGCSGREHVRSRVLADRLDPQERPTADARRGQRLPGLLPRSVAIRADHPGPDIEPCRLFAKVRY